MEMSTQVFHILMSLAAEPKHGYALLKDIEERSSGAVCLTASTLYGAIQRLLDSGWIEEIAVDDSTDSRRRTYRITVHGRNVARSEAQRLGDMVREARRVKLLPRTYEV